MTDHDPKDPACRCGWPDGTLDTARSLDAKPQARYVLGMLEGVPHWTRTIVGNEMDTYRQQAAASMESLVSQINEAFALQAERDRNMVEQVNAALASLESRVREVAASRSQVVVMPPVPVEPAVAVDPARLASAVAEKVSSELRSRSKVRNVERDRDGNIVRIIEEDAGAA